MRTLIIGIGNPLRGDDGLGWDVADELSRELQRDDVQVLATHQLTPELSEPVSNAERILFIDAARGGDPGILKCKLVVPIETGARHSHALSPETLLGMTQRLYGRCPAAYLLTIAGDSFDRGESLSAAVSAALPALRTQVHSLIDRDSWEEPAITHP
jgi:hydrogenase maturation protease